jgi:Flp pilus assembly protein TadG
MLVEFAIILPVLGALLIGMLSGGMAYSRKLSLTNGAREGARYGATLPVQNFANLDAWLDEVSSVAVDAVDDNLTDDAEGRVVCVAYVHPDGIATNDRTTRRYQADGATGYEPEPCFDDGRPNSERRVQVLLQRTSDLNALIYQHEVTLTGKSVARFEALTG